MQLNRSLLPILLVLILASTAHAATLDFTFGNDSKAVAGIKVTQTESDGTVTVYATDANGQITLPTTSNTYRLEASLAEVGSDPISVQDALYVLQHIVELRTLDADQIKAADINGDGKITIQDALKVLQHNVELTTINQSLIFYDANTGNLLSETTFNPGDTPSITVIRLGDVNESFDPGSITDHAPIITGSSVISVNENGVTVSLSISSDADSDAMTYSLSGTDASSFIIDASGNLSFVTAPDYESGKTSYSVTVTVTDGTNTVNRTFTINVIDVNENSSPVFTSNASFTVEENQTSAANITVTDADGDSLTYSLSGTDASSFTISSEGVLIFKEAPDYETKDSYSLIVTASDGTVSVNQTITLNISNVNESPVFISSDTFSVNENKTLVGVINASDDEGSALIYSLSGTDASLFSIEASQGIITFNVAPDYESGKTSYSLTISASDGSNKVTQDITINIINLNDNSPVISSSESFGVNENQQSIGTISASDADGDPMVFSISGDDLIISSSGVVSFKNAPDYETKPSYSATVTVSDGVNNTTQSISISINNLNDNSPVITSASSFSLDENQAALTTATYSDADGDISTYTFSLSGTDASALRIDASTGTITFKSAPNYEAKSSYSITIAVNDGVNTASQDIDISINNVLEDIIGFTRNVNNGTDSVAPSFDFNIQLDALMNASEVFILVNAASTCPDYYSYLQKEDDITWKTTINLGINVYEGCDYNFNIFINTNETYKASWNQQHRQSNKEFTYRVSSSELLDAGISEWGDLTLRFKNPNSINFDSDTRAKIYGYKANGDYPSSCEVLVIEGKEVASLSDTQCLEDLTQITGNDGNSNTKIRAEATFFSTQPISHLSNSTIARNAHYGNDRSSDEGFIYNPFNKECSYSEKYIQNYGSCFSVHMSAEYISGDVELSVFPNDAKFFTVIRNAPSTFGYYDQNETPIWTYIYDSGVGIASIRGETLSAPVYFGEIQNPIADGDTPYIESIETQAVFNESKNRYFLENTVNVNNPSAVGVNSGLRDIWYSLATPSCTEMTIYIKDELDNVNNPGGTFTVTESVPMLKNFSEKGQYFVDTLLITTNTGADYTYGFEVNNMTIGNSTRRCRFRNVFLNPPWPIVEGEFSFDAKEDLMSNIFMEGNLDDASFELVGNLSEILSIDQNGVITGSLDFDNIAIPYTISYPHISQLGGQVETKNISGYLKIVDSDGIFAHLSLSLGFYAADN